LSQGIKSVLKRLEKKGKSLMMSGAPWEDEMMDFKLSLDGLTQPEKQLINNWISAWRTRIIKTNGLKSRS
jgi:hypothetical protein